MLNCYYYVLPPGNVHSSRPCEVVSCQDGVNTMYFYFGDGRRYRTTTRPAAPAHKFVTLPIKLPPCLVS